MDVLHIGRVAAAECARQQVGVRELSWLLSTYHLITKGDVDFMNLNGFRTIGTLVEPGANRMGFRKTPVTFANGGTAANHADIERLMTTLCNLMKDTEHDREHDEAARLVKEFLWIRPFVDGNGRVGFLLYNWLSGTMDYPYALPNYKWS